MQAESVSSFKAVVQRDWPNEFDLGGEHNQPSHKKRPDIPAFFLSSGDEPTVP